MPSFKTQGQINLQPNDNIGYSFEVTVASSVSTNDGTIPYGTTVSSVVVIVYDKDDTIITTDLVVGTPTISSNIISIQLKYPTINGVGRYKITMLLTLSSGDTKELDFDRLYARNK